MPYRLVDHTADLAIEATGGTDEEALADAAMGLTEVVTGKPGHHVVPQEEIRFQLDTPDPESMVVAFLSELLWLLESRDLLWLGGGVKIGPGPDGSRRVTATGNGIRYDPAVHGRGVEVKAVTYHDLVFRREAGVWRLWVLLDI